MPHPSRTVAAVTLFSHLSLLPVLGGGCQTWRPASREAVLDVATQPNVDDRILIVEGQPNRVALGGDALLRIHTGTGLVVPVASRGLHFGNGVLQLQAQGSASVQLQPREIQWGEVQISDDDVSGLTWIPISQESVVDIASQPDVEHRVLEMPTKPEKIDIDGETPVRIQTSDGIKGPMPSRYLHSSGADLEVASPWQPPVRVNPLGADFRVPDHKATLGLVLGITIPVALLLTLFAAAAAAELSAWGHGPALGPGSF